MTDYFDILNQYDLNQKENEELHAFVAELNSKIFNLKGNKSDDSVIISDTPKLLKALVLTYKDNRDKNKEGYRYKDELIRNSGIFSRDLGGKQTYGFWEKKIPLPGLSSVAVYSKTSSPPFIEGSFRFDELS